MIKVSARVEGLDSLINNINKILPTETEKASQIVSLCGEALEYCVQENANLMDEHTQAWLNENGNPYRVGNPTNSGPHGDDRLVHVQSGLLISNIERQEDMLLNGMTVAVGVNKDNVPYIEDLIRGNTHMRPRNFLQKGFEEAEPVIKSILGG